MQNLDPTYHIKLIRHFKLGSSSFSTLIHGLDACSLSSQMAHARRGRYLIDLAYPVAITDQEPCTYPNSPKLHHHHHHHLSRTYIKEKKTPLLSVSHTQGVRIIRFVAIRNRRQKHKRSPINDNSAFFQQLLLSHLMHHTTPTQPPPPPPQNPRSCFICSHYSHNFHNCTSVRVNYTNIYSEN